METGPLLAAIFHLLVETHANELEKKSSPSTLLSSGPTASVEVLLLWLRNSDGSQPQSQPAQAALERRPKPADLRVNGRDGKGGRRVRGEDGTCA